MQVESEYFKVSHNRMKDISWNEMLGRKVQLPVKIICTSSDILCDHNPIWLESKKHFKGILKLVYTTYDAKECELNHLLVQDGDEVYAYIANFYGDSFIAGIIDIKSEKDETED